MSLEIEICLELGLTFIVWNLALLYFYGKDLPLIRELLCLRSLPSSAKSDALLANRNDAIGHSDGSDGSGVSGAAGSEDGTDGTTGANGAPSQTTVALDEEKVVKQGNLTKRGGQVRNWKTRQFTLQGRYLKYYEGNSNKGGINLTGARIQILQPAQCDKKVGAFVIFSKHRNLFLAAPSDQEREEWVAALNHQIELIASSDDTRIHHHLPARVADTAAVAASTWATPHHHQTGAAPTAPKHPEQPQPPQPPQPAQPEAPFVPRKASLKSIIERTRSNTVSGSDSRLSSVASNGSTPSRNQSVRFATSTMTSPSSSSSQPTESPERERKNSVVDPASISQHSPFRERSVSSPPISEPQHAPAPVPAPAPAPELVPTPALASAPASKTVPQPQPQPQQQLPPIREDQTAATAPARDNAVTSTPTRASDSSETQSASRRRSDSNRSQSEESNSNSRPSNLGQSNQTPIRRPSLNTSATAGLGESATKQTEAMEGSPSDPAPSVKVIEAPALAPSSPEPVETASTRSVTVSSPEPNKSRPTSTQRLPPQSPPDPPAVIHVANQWNSDFGEASASASKVPERSSSSSMLLATPSNLCNSDFGEFSRSSCVSSASSTVETESGPEHTVSKPSHSALNQQRISAIDDSAFAKWKPLAYPHEKILACGPVGKRNPMGLIQTRQLILMSTPRLLYADPVTMVVKGEVKWYPNMHERVEKVNVSSFKIDIDNRTYKFTDTALGAQYWIDKIRDASYHHAVGY